MTWYVHEIAVSMQMAVRRWQLDDGSSMAAAVAYYLALSVMPMLLVLTSGLGLFLKYTNLGHDAEVHILAVVHEHCSPTLEEQLRSTLLQFEDQSLVGGPFGIATAVLAAIGVFYQFERAFDKIWRIPQSKHAGMLGFATSLLGKRLTAFLMLGGVGLAIAGVMMANIAIGIIRGWMTNLPLAGSIAITVVDATATMTLNTIAFSLLYRTLPKRRVKWRDAFRSGLLVALAWEVGREFLFSFLINSSNATTYGAVGSFIALLLWFYWGVTLLLFGAEYLQVLSLRNRRPLAMFDPSGVENQDRLDRSRLRRVDRTPQKQRSILFGNRRGTDSRGRREQLAGRRRRAA